MLLGTWLRIKLIEKFEHATTLVNARHITNATDSFDVTAKAEQIPNTCKPIGLFANIGSNKTLQIKHF